MTRCTAQTTLSAATVVPGRLDVRRIWGQRRLAGEVPLAANRTPSSKIRARLGIESVLMQGWDKCCRGAPAPEPAQKFKSVKVHASCEGREVSAK